MPRMTIFRGKHIKQNLVPFKHPSYDVLKSILTLIKAGWLLDYPTVKEEGQRCKEASEALYENENKKPFSDSLFFKKSHDTTY